MATEGIGESVFDLSQFDPSARHLKNGTQEWIHPLLPAIQFDTATGSEHIQDHPGIGWIPDGPLLDRLFASEKLQLTKLFAGLRTWEAKVLSQPEAYAPAGTDGVEASPLSWFDLDSITVNEDTWLKSLRRDRWTDFERPISGWPGKFWRASDDDVWAFLRPVVELANRIIVTSIDHHWLGSLLHPESIEFIKDIFVYGGKRFDMQRVRVMARENRVTREEGVVIIGEALDNRLLWALHDEHHSVAVGRASAYCFHVDLHTAWGSLDVRLLREIFDQSMNEGLPLERRRVKRAMAGYFAALVLVHEFMHAVATPLARAAILRGPIPPELTERYRFNMREPFFDDEWVCEVGASYCDHMFGMAPDSSLDLNGWLVILTGQPFPTNYMNQNNLTYGINEPRLWPSQVRDVCHPQPTLWSNAHLSEAFWTSRIEKYGARALRSPGLLVSQMSHYSLPGGDAWYHVVHRARPVAARLRQTVPHDIELTLERVLTTLEVRQRLWAQWRSPWYDEAYAKWKFSPHSVIGYRELFQHGVAALFQARDLSAATKLLSKALSLIRPYPYPASDEDENAWPLAFWRALGYLIMAAIPRYGQPLSIQYPLPSYPNVWMSTHPDADVRRYQTAQIEQSYVFFQNKLREENPPVLYEVAIPRDDCFELAARQAEWYNANCPVPLSPSCEVAIGALWTRLRAQADMRADDEWLDFEFALPPFDPCEIQAGSAEAKMHWRGIHGTPPSSPVDVTMPEAPALNAFSAVVQEEVEDLGEARRARRTGLRYFTWGEVGDHQPGTATGDWWVVKQNGEEFDVYDISDIVRELRLSDSTVRGKIATRTGGPRMPLRVLAGDSELSTVSEDLAGMMRVLRPIGRVLQYARREDVTLRDGLDGRPAWVIIGGNVFDITDFDFLEEEHDLRELLLDYAGGTPVLALQEEGHDCVEVAELLASCRSRVIQSVMPSQSVVDDAFTIEEVGAIRSDEAALYTIIHGNVYSLGSKAILLRQALNWSVEIDRYTFDADYVDFHPGGASILREIACLDATDEFMWYHGEEETEMLQQIQHLRVGRIVDSRRGDSLASTEILMAQNVYDIERLGGDESEQKLRDGLQLYAGSDATEELRSRRRNAGTSLKPETGHVLFQLSRRKDLIVGRVLGKRSQHPVVPVQAGGGQAPEPTALPPQLQPPLTLDSGNKDTNDMPALGDVLPGNATVGPVTKLNTTIKKKNWEKLLRREEREGMQAVEEVVCREVDLAECDAWDEARRRERKRAGSELDLLKELEAQTVLRRRSIEEGLKRLREAQPGFFGKVLAPSCK